MEDCSLHHDCETAHTVDPANEEYNRRHMEALDNQYSRIDHNAMFWFVRKLHKQLRIKQ